MSGRVKVFERQIKMGALASDFTGYQSDGMCYVEEITNKKGRKRKIQRPKEKIHLSALSVDLQRMDTNQLELVLYFFFGKCAQLSF